MYDFIFISYLMETLQWQNCVFFPPALAEYRQGFVHIYNENVSIVTVCTDSKPRQLRAASNQFDVNIVSGYGIRLCGHKNVP